MVKLLEMIISNGRKQKVKERSSTFETVGISGHQFGGDLLKEM